MQELFHSNSAVEDSAEAILKRAKTTPRPWPVPVL
jgi:hypothetical protein